jgi:hypothetical protein
VADKDIKYTDEVIRAIALKVVEDMLASTDDMKKHVLLEVVEALKQGEDVYDDLLDTILTRPFMERFIDELIKYENERE